MAKAIIKYTKPGSGFDILHPLEHLVIQMNTNLWQQVQIFLLNLIMQFPRSLFQLVVLLEHLYPVNGSVPQFLLFRTNDSEWFLNVGGIFLNLQWLMS